MMQCPKCDSEKTMVKSALCQFELHDGQRYLDIEWEAFCVDCGYQCSIEETFVTTGTEYEKEE